MDVDKELSRDEALRVLGLSTNATGEEIQSRFRELVKATHPDQGGKGEDLEELIAARSALAEPHQRNLPVRTLDQVLSIVTERAEKGALSAALNVRADSLKDYTRRRTLASYRARKRVMGWVASLAALGPTVVIYIVKNMQSLLGLGAGIAYNSATQFDAILLIIGMGLFCAVVSGLAYATLRADIALIDQWIEDLNADLEDKQSFAEFLLNLAGDQESYIKQGFDVKTLESVLENWRTRIAIREERPQAIKRYISSLILTSKEGALLLLVDKVGLRDAARFLIARGQALGLLAEEADGEGLRFAYRWQRKAAGS